MKHDSWSNLMFMLGKEIPLIGQTSLFPLVYTHAHVHKRSHIHVCILRQSPWVLILYLSVITVCFLLHVVPNFSPFGLAPLSLSLLSSHPTLLCLETLFCLLTFLETRTTKPRNTVRGSQRRSWQLGTSCSSKGAMSCGSQPPVPLAPKYQRAPLGTCVHTETLKWLHFPGFLSLVHPRRYTLTRSAL